MLLETTTYEPSVRGDVALLNGGRRGMDEDTRAVCGAVLLDAALAGVIDVTGRRVMGIDRRRVVAGPATSDDPLLADLRRRVEIAKPDSPDGWLDRIAVFGEDAVRDELVEAGVARPVQAPVWRRWLRHRTLEPVNGSVDEARARLHEDTVGAAAVAVVLRETDLLSEMVGRKDARRIGKKADRQVEAMPPAARAVIATLKERKRRADRVGTYYADD